MATLQDSSIGIGVESTFKTYATPTRWYEFTDESLDWTKTVVQGEGLRVGSRVARSARRVVPAAQGAGGITIEAVSKGLGLLLRNALGTASSTLVSGSTYQQVFTLGTATPSSLTVQKGMVRVDGTVDPVTFLGCMVNQLTIDMPNAGVPTMAFDIDAADLTTAQSYVAPSYPTAPSLFHWGGGSGFKVFTGTYTAPTTTALASATTPLTNIRSGNVAINQNLIADRFNSGGAGRKAQQIPGMAEPSGTITAEYDSTTLRDAMINDTALALIFQYEGAALSTGVETLQVCIPAAKINSPLPQVNGTDLVTTDYTFSILDDLTNSPIAVVLRTSDTAL